MSDHAISNARAWLATIQEYHLALALLEGDDPPETATADGEIFDDADAVRQRIEESVLSVGVRDGWRSLGEKGEAEEYRILLTTGGPALQITGELNQWGEPDDYPSLRWQDWGTPWTSLDLTEDERAAVCAFARVFYFGEG